jgi:arsenite oxidase small subunit
MQRREFVKICAASAAAACAGATFADNPSSRAYNRVKLVDKDGAPVKLKALKVNHNYIFNYPFESTPCFLLNLDKPMPAKVDLKTEAGKAYQWPGGAGPQRTLVAYSAICAHKLAYPTSQVSFISFRTQPGKASKQSKVISCCADSSVYDPYAGAKVISGPAPQPLAAILLEHDPKTDEIYAIGTFGGEKFNDFFQKYEFKLDLEMGDRAREKVKSSAKLTDLVGGYSLQAAQC